MTIKKNILFIIVILITTNSLCMNHKKRDRIGICNYCKKFKQSVVKHEKYHCKLNPNRKVSTYKPGRKCKYCKQFKVRTSEHEKYHCNKNPNRQQKNKGVLKKKRIFSRTKNISPTSLSMCKRITRSMKKKQRKRIKEKNKKKILPSLKKLLPQHLYEPPTTSYNNYFVDEKIVLPGCDVLGQPIINSNNTNLVRLKTLNEIFH